MADPRRAAARASARTRILDVAVGLIAREGLDEVRIARIAVEAGVSAALLHYHFASRDALLAEALDRAYELAAQARIGPGDAPVPAAERLAWMIDRCLPGEAGDWRLWIELWRQAARRPGLRLTSARLYARLRDQFADVLEDLGAADPAGAADRLLALIDGFGVRVAIEDPAMPLARARAEIRAAIAPVLGKR